MNNLVVVNPSTIVRANVIAKRTQSVEVGLVKAMMIETLKAKLSAGVCKFAYMKKDGSVRIAYGTTSSIVANDHIIGTGPNREYFKTTAYFDIERGEWRSFRWENIITVF